MIITNDELEVRMDILNSTIATVVAVVIDNRIETAVVVAAAVVMEMDGIQIEINIRIIIMMMRMMKVTKILHVD